MENRNFQGYVASLERVVKNSHLDLREVMDLFKELCQRVTPEKAVPMGMITNIHQTYKEIQDHLTKIKGVNQLLEGKYRRYYRRDPLRDREIMESAFLAKSLYSKVERTLQENEAKTNSEHTDAYPEGVPAWFHSHENQIALLRTLEHLYKLNYSNHSEREFVRRREVVWDGMRSISLFVLSGEAPLIDILQPRIRLREYDIKERFTRNEIRGALTHLRQMPASEAERVIRRFMDNAEFSKLKCLLLSVRSQKDLEKEILGVAKNLLRVMKDGEVRALSV